MRLPGLKPADEVLMLNCIRRGISGALLAELVAVFRFHPMQSLPVKVASQTSSEAAIWMRSAVQIELVSRSMQKSAGSHLVPTSFNFVNEQVTSSTVNEFVSGPVDQW